jgi:hypothetical protein
MLMKDTTKQSGVHFDAKAARITTTPVVWKNIIESHPKVKMFRSKSFPLFEALGELHDGKSRHKLRPLLYGLHVYLS